MKIAIFTPSFLPKVSGAEIFHHNLATELKAAGLEPVVIVPRRTRAAILEKKLPLTYALEVFPANVWSLFKRSEWLGKLAVAWHLNRLQRRHRFDVWHAVMTYPTGIALVEWASQRGIPHLVRCAGDDIIAAPERGVGLRLDSRIDGLIRKWLPQAQRVISLSAAISEEYVRIGIAPDRIEFIPNAVDLPRFQQPVDRAAFRSSLGLSNDAFLFMAVGRNHPQKNYPVLLDALAQLHREGRKFHLLIVGRDAEALEKAAVERGLGGCVIAREMGLDAAMELPPRRLLEAYRSADAFVMPSVLEGFSSALLEAMAAGLPVITTDGPGCRDFIRAGQDAIMVPCNDVSALSIALREMLDQPEQRQEYRERALRRAAMFGWPVILERYRSLYQTLIRERRRTKS